MQTENELIQMYKDHTVDGRTSMKGMAAMAYVFLDSPEEERDEFLQFLEKERDEFLQLLEKEKQIEA